MNRLCEGYLFNLSWAQKSYFSGWYVKYKKEGKNQWLQAVVILQGKYQSVSLKGIVLYLSQY